MGDLIYFYLATHSLRISICREGCMQLCAVLTSGRNASLGKHCTGYFRGLSLVCGLTDKYLTISHRFLRVWGAIPRGGVDSNLSPAVGRLPGLGRGVVVPVGEDLAGESGGLLSDRGVSASVYGGLQQICSGTRLPDMCPC